MAFDICLFKLQSSTGPSWPAEIRMDRERKSAAWGSGRREREGQGEKRREDRPQTAPLFQSKMEAGTRNPREWSVARTQAFLSRNELIPF